MAQKSVTRLYDLPPEILDLITCQLVLSQLLSLYETNNKVLQQKLRLGGVTEIRHWNPKNASLSERRQASNEGFDCDCLIRMIDSIRSPMPFQRITTFEWNHGYSIFAATMRKPYSPCFLYLPPSITNLKLDMYFAVDNLTHLLAPIRHDPRFEFSGLKNLVSITLNSFTMGEWTPRQVIQLMPRNLTAMTISNLDFGHVCEHAKDLPSSLISLSLPDTHAPKFLTQSMFDSDLPRTITNLDISAYTYRVPAKNSNDGPMLRSGTTESHSTEQGPISFWFKELQLCHIGLYEVKSSSFDIFAHETIPLFLPSSISSIQLYSSSSLDYGTADCIKWSGNVKSLKGSIISVSFPISQLPSIRSLTHLTLRTNQSTSILSRILPNMSTVLPLLRSLELPDEIAQETQLIDQFPISITSLLVFDVQFYGLSLPLVQSIASSKDLKSAFERIRWPFRLSLNCLSPLRLIVWRHLPSTLTDLHLMHHPVDLEELPSSLTKLEGISWSWFAKRMVPDASAPFPNTLTHLGLKVSSTIYPSDYMSIKQLRALPRSLVIISCAQVKLSWECIPGRDETAILPLLTLPADAEPEFYRIFSHISFLNACLETDELLLDVTEPVAFGGIHTIMHGNFRTPSSHSLHRAVFRDGVTTIDIMDASFQVQGTVSKYGCPLLPSTLTKLRVSEQPAEQLLCPRVHRFLPLAPSLSWIQIRIKHIPDVHTQSGLPMLTELRYLEIKITGGQVFPEDPNKLVALPEQVAIAELSEEKTKLIAVHAKDFSKFDSSCSVM